MNNPNNPKPDPRLYKLLLLFFDAYTVWHDAPDDKTFACVDALSEKVSEALKTNE